MKSVCPPREPLTLSKGTMPEVRCCGKWGGRQSYSPLLYSSSQPFTHSKSKDKTGDWRRRNADFDLQIDRLTGVWQVYSEISKQQNRKTMANYRSWSSELRTLCSVVNPVRIQTVASGSFQFLLFIASYIFYALSPFVRWFLRGNQ